MNLANFQRVAHFFYRKKMTPIAKLIYKFNFLLFNSSVPPAVKIGKNSVFAYGGIGVVINKRVSFGENCVIGQGITIGGRGTDRPGKVTVGNHVFIGAGARILGTLTIGDWAIVAPNAVVLEDVPEGCIVGGMPAKIIRRGVNASNQHEFV